jgi:vitamin B12 transporter
MQGSKESSFSEEKEAKRLFSVAYRLALPAESLAPRSAHKSLLVLFFRKELLSSLPFLFLSTPTQAQNTATPSETVVVTATRVPSPGEDIAAGVTVIDRQTIEQRGYTDLTQALSAVPGLRVAQTGGFGSQASVFIRGTDSNHVLVLRDGVPINDPGDPGGAFNFGEDTLNDVERIEIIRGPLSGLYGSGAIGGVINIITRKGAKGLHGDLTLAGGSNHTGLVRAHADGRESIWDFSATLEGYSTRGFDQTPERETTIYTGAANGGRSNMGEVEIGLSPFTNTRFWINTRVRQTISSYDEQYYVTYDGNNTSARDASTNFRGGVTSTLLDGAWNTALTLSELNNDRRYEVTYTPQDPNDYTQNSSYHGRRAEAQWANTIHLPDYAFTDQTAVTFGYDHTSDTANTNINETSFGYPYASTVQAHDDTDSGWAGAQTRLAKRLTLTGQLREDATTIAGSAFTWRTGGVIDIPEAWLHIKASYGTGFRAPALYDRYGLDSYGFHGNPNLRPEQSQGWEAGATIDLPPPPAINAASISVTYFDNRIHNLIEYTFAPTYTEININQARAKGIESGLSAHATNWLQADFTYTYTDARNLETNTLLLRRPLNQASADLRLTPFPGFNIVPELIYTGRFSDYLTNNDGVPTTIGYSRSGLIANLSVEYQATHAIKFFIWAKNLGASQFEPVNGYVTSGPSVLAGTKVSF